MTDLFNDATFGDPSITEVTRRSTEVRIPVLRGFPLSGYPGGPEFQLERVILNFTSHTVGGNVPQPKFHATYSGSRLKKDGTPGRAFSEGRAWSVRFAPEWMKPLIEEHAPQWWKELDR